MKKLILALLVCPFLGSAQIISTIAGNGTSGNSGNGGLATAAEFNYPDGIAVDDSGNVYFSDYHNGQLWKINTSGIISIVAGNGTCGYSGDGGGATSAELSLPCKVDVDNSGNIYVADWGNNRIRKINTTGIISTIAGNGTAGYSGDGGSAIAAELNGPEGLSTVDDSGNIYICDEVNNSIRKVNSVGIISTFAGNGTGGYTGDGGLAAYAELDYPRGAAFDNYGNIYISDYNNNVIRKVSSSGIISTIAGNGIAGYSGDGGSAIAAELNGPSGLAIFNKGGENHGVDIYFADENNAVIRKVTSSGIISTVAGNGTEGYGGDGGLATDAELNYPVDVAVDNSGNVYIVDAYNYRIRKISSGTTEVNNLTSLLQLSIFPNPVTSKITISASDRINTIAFSNLLGQLIYSEQFDSKQVQVDVAYLPAGTYFVKVNGTEVRKFVKE